MKYFLNSLHKSPRFPLNSHPNLFWGMIICGLWSVTLGIILLVNCNSYAQNLFGILLMFVGFGLVINCFLSFKGAKVFMAFNMALCFALGLGLGLELWSFCPLIQILMWVFYAIIQMPFMAEPSLNPLTRKTH